MSPKREPISHELSHERSRHTEASAEKLFQKAQKNGRIDLSKFSKDEQQVLYSWYERNSTTLPHDDRMQFLEQCIANKIIDDKQLLGHVETYTKTLKESGDDLEYNEAKLSLQTIGEYLVYMKDPAYLQSLWECWYEIPFQTREDLKYYCTREKPELAILIAPFTDISKLRVIYSKKTGERTTIRPSSTLYRSGGIRIIDRWSSVRKEQDEEETNFIDHYLKNFEDARPFIEASLAYYERHHKETSSRRREDERLQKIPYYSFDYSPSDPQEITDIRDTLREMNKAFLFPYLKKIEELGIQLVRKEPWKEREESEKERTNIQLFLQKENIPYCDPKHFFTKKEQAEIEHLRKVFIKHNPKMAKRLESDESGSLAAQEGFPPEQHRRALMRILDAGNIRAAHTLLDSFQEYKHHLSEKEQEEFLLECLERKYPIFAVIDKLDFSKKEVANLFRKAAQQELGSHLNDLHTNADIVTLLTYNTSHPEEPDIERLITISFTKDLSSSGCSLGFERLIRYQGTTVFSLFSRENQATIIQAIDTHYPDIWLVNIPLALEHSSLPLHEILNSLDGHELLKNYQAIIHHIQQLEKKGIQTGVTIQDVRTCARTIILSSPLAFFSYPQIVKESLTDAEQKNYIASKLIPPVQSRFLTELLSSSLKDIYKEQCKKILEKDDVLLDICMHSYLGKRHAIELLGKKKIFAYSLKKIGSDLEVVKDILNDTDVFKEFLASQTSITAYLKEIKKTGSYELTVDILGRIRSMLSNIEYAKKTKRKISLDISVARLKELEALFINAAKEACDKNPFLIFDGNIRAIPEFNAKERIAEHADAYFAEYPEKLLEQTYGGNKHFIYRELLGDEVFLSFITRHARTLALSGKFDHYNFPFFDESIQEKFATIDPTLRVLLKEKLEGDFYDVIFSEIQHSAFFKLHETRLRDIAAKEQELYGVQDAPENISVPEEFTEITRRIILLESNACAQKNAEFFLRLPEKQRDHILHTLEFLSTNNLDIDIPFDPKTETVDVLLSRIQKRIHTFFEQTFDIALTESTLKKLDTLSVEGLGAFSIYYKKICSKYPAMKERLQECVARVVDGTYETWRLPDTEMLHELQDSNLLPKNITPKQYDAWKKEDTLDLEEVLQYDIASIYFGIRKILEQAIADEHIDPMFLSLSMQELQSRYAKLTQPLQELVDRQKELQVYFKAHKGEITPDQQEEYDSLKETIAQYMADNKVEMALIKAFQYIHALKKISPRDLEDKMLTTEEKKRIPFSEVFKTMSIALQKDFPYFAGDMARIQSVLSEGRQNIFSGDRVSKTKLFITDKLDLETYVRIGEKPVESCQHYNSKKYSREYNKGLLSYLIDPNIKIVQVYDAHKKIIARAILRLMGTRDGNPALFAERIYSVNSHPKINEAIENYVKQKANIMGVPYAMTEKSSIPEPLFQTGSRSPFVYTDAGGGLVPNGIFEIESASTIPFKFKGPEEVDKK